MFGIPSLASVFGGSSPPAASTPQVVLEIGDITFVDTEVPESIGVKFKQRNVIHKFLGGKRQIDVLGPDPDPLKWSGLLLGSDALSRAQDLAQMNNAGLTVTLSWSEYLFSVIVSEFEAEYERDYQINYTIVCEIVADLTQPSQSDAQADMDDLINGDMSDCSTLALGSGNAGVTSSVSTLSSAVSAVSSFATAAKSTINSVLAPIAAARTQVQQLIASNENTLQSVTTLGGVLPNNPLAQNVAKISQQINTVQSQSNMILLNATLGRMNTNLTQVNTGVKSIQVFGGTTYDLASKYYGDVSGWTAIQAANPQLNGDPNINGSQTIIIPPYKTPSGGILSD